MVRTSGRRWSVVIALCLALVAAACGKSSDKSSPTTEGASAGQPVVGGNLVDYQNWASGAADCAAGVATKSVNTISCVALKGVSVCVGASAFRAGVFKNDCTMATKTFR